MSFKGKVVLASNNQGKLKEFKALFEPLGIELVPQGELAVPEAEEPFDTFVENALAKARHASKYTGLPAIADDSGLTVNALAGAPGVLSARYATLFGEEKSDQNNNLRLLKQLENETDRSAAYIALLVFVRSAADPCPIIAQGVWKGEIAMQAAGSNGFGYDPYFYLPELGCTAAELAPEVKNRQSHRAIALKKLLADLQAN
ncbi:MAG: RdgB/HAM1 family non-canonical purine NTP pyrophosphatase [Advenella sp.]|uniref:RdgB/HAM1 family non-canonical purine NTP pyrophosphatase n=1 Tax=Advenella TaxID=290425 RepID=UPI0025868A3B|nr:MULTISPECIES: RdgB/HAM1 family non-canonical purine NTP pyrophosphatase [Advenella]MDD3757886.1 RdgB/HAM1 family non-canonical purine NTP pyrophosphatase [Advenella sp.]WKU18441.1 RdgB/HAM1 family non-canonical purine NTP pyrophosphatase [Advenella alkanexedens]